MFSALVKAVEQTLDPAFRKVFVKSLLLSLVTFVILWVGTGFVFSDNSGFIESFMPSWLADWMPDWIYALTGVALVVFVSFILFPAVMIAVMAFFLEDIASAVERKHYPVRTAGREQPVAEVLISALQFLGLTLAVNLLALPFYIMAIFIPGLSLVLYYLINGYLFGREYFEMIALRRMGHGEMKMNHSKLSGPAFRTGMLGAFLFTIPLVNLLTPLWMTAVMLHRYEGWREQGKLTESQS
ncbi:EI24 domain-containing protein [Kiloniella sp. b19]|uniref:EI24 domain-containing protein n=1 Tax=Kiloniella sp. GXU_MW_B19 TaxID=3141326 RepID=UPI0031D7FE91